MALQHEPTQESTIGDRSRSRTSKKEIAFRTHLAVYLCVGLFLFTLNLLTSPFELGFYWPLFFWGWGLVFHAVAPYGADAPSRVPGVLRSIVPWLSDASPGPSHAKCAASAAPFAAAAFANAHERIERLKEIAWQIPDGALRQQAERLTADAERIVAAMARDRADAETVNRFDAELLVPTESLLERYVRAAGAGAAGDETLRRIEENDLPLLQAQFAATSDQLQRGEPVDLPVAGEPPELDPVTPTRVPLRSHP